MKTVLAIAVCGVVSGCAVEPQLGTIESHVESQNRLAVNRLAVNRLAVNRLAVNRLAVNRLAVNGMAMASLDAEAIAAEPGGLDLLSYMVSCALPEGESLIVAEQELPGSIGLAPSWIDGGLDVAQRRWVSACLLARVNYFGVQVRLSLRGSNLALSVTDDEVQAYSLFEGAFWGDLFSDTIPEKRSCTSAYKATAPQVSTMPLRECTVTDEATGFTRCGFTPAGICESVCNHGTCAGESEVIEVYLETPVP